MEFNWRSLKETRGFLKILQMFLAAITFSIAVSATLHMDMILRCSKDNKTSNLKVVVSYPYSLDSVKGSFSNPICSQKEPPSIHFSHTSSSQFFVFVTVFGFIYSLACLIYFIIFEQDSTNPNFDLQQYKYYLLDISMSIFQTAFGLISFFCFIAVTVALKSLAGDSILNNLLKDVCSDPDITCISKNELSHGTLIASILFSLIYIGVWSASLYMMFKEKVWIKPRQEFYNENPDAYGYNIDVPVIENYNQSDPYSGRNY